VRGELVLASVPREERHGDASDVPDVERRRRVAVRRLDGHLLDVLEEGVEAGSAEDPDADGAQAERSLALPEGEEDELPLSPEEGPEEDPEEELASADFVSAFFSEGFFSEEVSESFFEPSPPEGFDRLSVE
jgi:hypothetical protein